MLEGGKIEARVSGGERRQIWGQYWDAPIMPCCNLLLFIVSPFFRGQAPGSFTCQRFFALGFTSSFFNLLPYHQPIILAEILVGKSSLTVNQNAVKEEKDEGQGTGGSQK